MSSEHKSRVITAVIGVTLIASVYYFLQHTGVLLITSAISLVAYYEFLKILLDKRSPEKLRKLKLWTSLGAASIMMALFTWKREWNLLPLYFSFLFFLLLAMVYSHKSENPSQSLPINLRDAITQVFGLFYITGFLSFVPAIHSLDQGPMLLLFLLLIIWGGDIGAYYGGKNFGRHKLSPNLSPGKTLEGSFAGLLLCVLICIPMQQYLFSGMSFGRLALIAVLTSIIAQAGDLLESLMKRVGEVKDSGTLFPGHGGVFDRFDSLILAAPVYYFLIHILT